MRTPTHTPSTCPVCHIPPSSRRRLAYPPNGCCPLRAWGVGQSRLHPHGSLGSICRRYATHNPVLHLLAPRVRTCPVCPPCLHAIDVAAVAPSGVGSTHCPGKPLLSAGSLGLLHSNHAHNRTTTSPAWINSLATDSPANFVDETQKREYPSLLVHSLCSPHHRHLPTDND